MRRGHRLTDAAPAAASGHFRVEDTGRLGMLVTVRANARELLLTLTRTPNADLGLRCTQLWHALSRAAHPHAYELSPTAAELRGWHRDVYRAVADLAAR